MSKSNIFSPEGTKRIEIDKADNTVSLYDKVHDVFNLTGYRFILYKEKGQKEELVSSRNKTLASYGLKHGDMIYMTPVNEALIWSSKPETVSDKISLPGTSGSITSKGKLSSSQVIEDEVDVILSKLDGKIQRKKDEKLCRHGSNACCVHCSPLEPFDENYLKEQNIKHLSFHSYLRKLTAGVDRGKFLALENISCSIKTGCKDHPPWPKGICTKCQPNAITLNRQVYRHTDNVMFENAHLVERFLNYWRSSGLQRVGFLYGKYEVHSDVPLGIRATVAAIYEPPQESSKDSINILPDDREQIVEELAQHLGLVRVGWIFTDLIADDVQKGTVKHVRNIESHFLSAQECITAGYLQNQRPNPCRFSSTGFFGSKFVTVCVTGDSSKQVHMEGYQVSGQCMALVRDGCLVPTKDAPELGYIAESTDKKFVPDVFYKLSASFLLIVRPKGNFFF
ncbi:nuclear protein localization, putative [Pediculus humanus corporis]|uniref:Nuclear protein localization protein 4 homolog n=1 Tax=Pediculus humanus subsp. corporis TaxID=121224 RepID=E0VEH8_PEDHC|nr:nuclear protein localization, putative [Pediculus humanus corporis]EEB11784.1 nuclear protein localization, putative [Pediculus humanus corporis]